MFWFLSRRKLEATSMEEITSAANELSKMAEELKESIATFKY